MSMHDDDFLSLLGDDAKDIKPIQVEERHSLVREQADKQSLTVKKLSALHFSSADNSNDPLASSDVDMVEPMDLLAFKRSGVQHGVYKNLRLGKYSLDATLDLHGMSMELARRNLYTFIQDCLDNDLRTVLITHGKGEGRATPALLKSCVNNWLPQMDEVLAFHTAQKQHGSYGATYVLLKKSERKKQENREKLRG